MIYFSNALSVPSKQDHLACGLMQALEALEGKYAVK